MNRRLLQVVVVAGLVGVIGAFTIRAEEKKTDQPKEKPVLTFDGEITAIDKVDRKITVRKFPVTKTFVVANDCKLTTTDKPEAELKDFKVGDKVKVKYEEAPESPIAHSMIIRGIDAEDRKDAEEKEKLAPKQ